MVPKIPFNPSPTEARPVALPPSGNRMPSPARAPPAPALHPPLQKPLLLLLGPLPPTEQEPLTSCGPHPASITRGATARPLGSPASLRLGETHSRRLPSGRRTARNPPTHTPFPGEGMRPPRWSHGWERGAGEGPTRDRGNEERPGSAPSPPPGPGASCAPPPTGPGGEGPGERTGRGRGNGAAAAAARTA